MRSPRDYAPGTTVIGYRDENAIYLLPDIALREIAGRIRSGSPSWPSAVSPRGWADPRQGLT
ncbi:MAG: hypothetical protein IPK19_37965 [Chloroflexi bacterium]|nr:hypothetical protein [Chloroflexota bacterium]